MSMHCRHSLNCVKKIEYGQARVGVWMCFVYFVSLPSQTGSTGSTVDLRLEAAFVEFSQLCKRHKISFLACIVCTLQK